MDFVRSYFDRNEPLTSWTLFSPLFDWFVLCAQQTSQKVRKKISTGQRFICTEVTSYKIHILVAQFAGILQDVMSWIDELTVYLQLKKNF